MKKTISALVSAALIAGTTMPVFAATFKDVNDKNYAWAYEYVEDMAEKGLISGYEDGTFKPEKSVSRMEAFALFARLIGSNSEINSDALKTAKEQYKDVLDKYDLSYAEGDVAFMLMRKVITEDELDTYFAGSKKSEAMPRHEAAVLITKAMLGEAAAKEEVLLDMDYSDVSDIPKNARQYVYYVTQKGIMNGMGDGKFSPMTDVLRSQIAVMLSRTVDTMNYSFEAAKLAGIDVKSKNLTIRDDEGNNYTIGYNDNTVFTKKGEIIKASDLKKGENIVLTYTEDDGDVKLAFADVIVLEADATLTGIFSGYTSIGGKLTISISDPLTNKTKSYDMSTNATVTIDGSVSDLNKLNSGDYVTVGFADDIAVSVATMQKSATIKDATITDIDILGAVTISSNIDEYDGLTLRLSSNARITKNGNDAELLSIYKGDKANIVLEYGMISKLNASSTTKTISGVIKSYTVSSSPSITIKKDGEEFTYDIPADIEVTINNEPAKLADFEIGSSVTLTTESGAVKKVAAKSATGTNIGSTINGVVTGVNAAANVIIVSYNDGDTETTAYITCTNSTKFMTLPDFNNITIKNIKVGDMVSAYGSYSNGIFVGTGITVTPAEK